MDIYDIVSISVFLLLWFLLTVIVFPKLGIRTWMSSACDTQLGKKSKNKEEDPASSEPELP